MHHIPASASHGLMGTQGTAKSKRPFSEKSSHHAACTVYPNEGVHFCMRGMLGVGGLQEQKVRYSLQTGWLQPKRVTHRAWETIQSAGISLAWLGWRRIPMTDFCVKKTKNRSDLFNVCHLSFPMTAVMSLSFQFSFTLARTKPPLPKIIGDDWRGERSLPSQRDSLPQDLPHISFRSHVSANFSSLHLEPKEKKLKTNKACNNSFRTCYSLFNLQLKLPYFLDNKAHFFFFFFLQQVRVVLFIYFWEAFIFEDFFRK